MSEFAAELAELMPDKVVAPKQGIGINVRRLLRLRGIIMAVVFVGLLIPLLAAIWFFIPKQYIAVGNVKFKAVSPQILGGEGRTLTGSSYEIFVNTQIEYLTGSEFIEEVVKDPEIQQKLTHITRSADPRAYVKSHLSAEVVRMTELVTLSYSDITREAALLVMGKILEKYDEHLKQEVSERGGYARQALETRLDALTKEYEEAQRAIVTERESRGIPAGATAVNEPAETESIRTNLSQAEADLTRAEVTEQQVRRSQADVQALIEGYERDPNTSIYDYAVEEKTSQHPSVTFLNEQVASVQQQFATFEDRYVDGAPQVKVKERELEALKAKLENARAEARGEALHSVAAQLVLDLERVQTEIEEAVTRRDRFKAALADYETQAVQRSEGMAQIAELERQTETKRARIEQMRSELFRIDLESNAPAQVTPDKSAWAASSPDQSDRIKLAAVALFAVFLLSLSVGVALEGWDQNIRSGEDIAYVTTYPVLASIPHTAEDRLPVNAAPGLLSAEYSDSFTADEFRRAAARMLLAPGGRETKSCIVASAARGDGKTVLACNLALVLARAGRRVLLVDVDTHTPGVERTFGLRPSAGLAEMLAGTSLDHDPDQSTDHENLFVLGPGLNTRDLMSRLASREMADFLAGAVEVFDHVLIDTPASLLKSEARLLAPMVDGVLVVVGSGITTFGMLRRALRGIEETGAQVLGVVLNGLRQSPFGYLRRNLAMYYDERKGHPRDTIVPGPRGPGGRESGKSIVLVHDASGDA